MIFSGSHFGVINPFHPLLAKLSGLMMVSTCLCYHHQHWLHPVRVRGGRFYWGCLELELTLAGSSHHSPLTLQSLPVSDVGGGGGGGDDDGVGGVVSVRVVLVRQGQCSP